MLSIYGGTVMGRWFAGSSGERSILPEARVRRGVCGRFSGDVKDGAAGFGIEMIS
jgi:hypothetical protein